MLARGFPLPVPRLRHILWSHPQPVALFSSSEHAVPENSGRKSSESAGKRMKRKTGRGANSKKRSKPQRLDLSRTTKPSICTWTGLSITRLQRMRSVRCEDLSPDFGLTVAINSALESPFAPFKYAERIVRSIGSSFPSATHASVIKCAVRCAEECGMESASPPDVAIETFIRLEATSRPTSDSLAIVADFAALDDVVERRAERAASIMRFVLHKRFMVSEVVLRAVFNAFVEGLDFRAALATLMLSHDMYTSISSTDRAYWYERLMYAAMVRREFEVVDSARQRKRELNLPTTVYGQNVDLSCAAELGNYESAVATARALRKTHANLEHFALASLIRAAGVQHDMNSVREFYSVFEKSLGGCSKKFAKSLSLLVSAKSASITAFSARTAEFAKTDPTQAIFHALRQCGQAEESISLVRRLHRQYGVQFSGLLYSTISETCFRANRLNLATRLRKEIRRVSKQQANICM